MINKVNMSHHMTQPTKWLCRVFAVRMKKAQVFSYPLSAQRRLWSDWADAQADLSLRWAHSHFVGFVMSRLNYQNFSSNYYAHLEYSRHTRRGSVWFWCMWCPSWCIWYPIKKYQWLKIEFICKYSTGDWDMESLLKLKNEENWC